MSNMIAIILLDLEIRLAMDRLTEETSSRPHLRQRLLSSKCLWLWKQKLSQVFMTLKTKTVPNRKKNHLSDWSSVYVHVCVCVCVCMRTCMCACVHESIHIHVHACKCVSLHDSTLCSTNNKIIYSNPFWEQQFKEKKIQLLASAFWQIFFNLKWSSRAVIGDNDTTPVHIAAS